MSMKSCLQFSIHSMVPSIGCSVLKGRCAAPVAPEAPVHVHRVFSAAPEPAGSPVAPHSSAERGGLHLHPCTMQTELLWKENEWEENWVNITTNYSLKYSHGNELTLPHTVTTHTNLLKSPKAIFVQVLLSYWIIGDSKYRICCESKFLALLNGLFAVSWEF